MYIVLRWRALFFESGERLGTRVHQRSAQAVLRIHKTKELTKLIKI